MELSGVIRARQSIRAFLPADVEEEKLRAILEAANAAPSAGNLQAYEIYVTREKARRRALVSAALGQEFLAQAPVALVFCANPSRAARKYGQRGASLYAVQDATIACTFAMLMITDLGLATVWVGAFDDDGIRHAIGAPEGHRPVAILPVGYPAESPERTSRRSLGNIVHSVS